MLWVYSVHMALLTSASGGPSGIIYMQEHAMSSPLHFKEVGRANRGSAGVISVIYGSWYRNIGGRFPCCMLCCVVIIEIACGG